MIWLVSVLCFCAGLYIAIDNTIFQFSHNYLLAPLGDEAVDAARVVYPIALGTEGWGKLFSPFADHRMVLTRLQQLFDFFYTDGMQPIQPYRFAILLWLNTLIFSVFIILNNASLNVTKKVLLSGVYLAITFAPISVNNYYSTMMTTWPYVLLFGLLSFVCTSKYCSAIANQANRKSLLYLFFTFLFVTLAVLIFNIGLLIWPIIFVVLFKEKCFKKHWYLWSLALLTYPLYFYQWIPVQGRHGAMVFWQHPIDVFLYMSRVLSIPVIPSAVSSASLSTIVFALFILFFSVLFLFNLLKKDTWSEVDRVLFAYFIFGFLSVCIISAMRFWMTAEAAVVGSRFTTPSLVITACLLVSFFSMSAGVTKESLWSQLTMSMVTMVWLVAFFIPSNPVFFDNGNLNQLFVSQAIDIPIDQGFVEATKDMHNFYDPAGLSFLNDTQKKYKKSVYSLWASQYLKHSVPDLNFKEIECHGNVAITVGLDFRQYNNPGLFVSVNMEKQQVPINKNWQVVFANDDNLIIGFAVPGPMYFPLINRLQGQKNASLIWRGAINTALLIKNNKVVVWAGDNQSHQLCKLGEIVIK